MADRFATAEDIETLIPVLQSNGAAHEVYGRILAEAEREMAALILGNGTVSVEAQSGSSFLFGSLDRGVLGAAAAGRAIW